MYNQTVDGPKYTANTRIDVSSLEDYTHMCACTHTYTHTLTPQYAVSILASPFKMPNC